MARRDSGSCSGRITATLMRPEILFPYSIFFPKRAPPLKRSTRAAVPSARKGRRFTALFNSIFKYDQKAFILLHPLFLCHNCNIRCHQHSSSLLADLCCKAKYAKCHFHGNCIPLFFTGCKYIKSLSL